MSRRQSEAGDAETPRPGTLALAPPKVNPFISHARRRQLLAGRDTPPGQTSMPPHPKVATSKPSTRGKTRLLSASQQLPDSLVDDTDDGIPETQLEDILPPTPKRQKHSQNATSVKPRGSRNPRPGSHPDDTIDIPSDIPSSVYSDSEPEDKQVKPGKPTASDAQVSTRPQDYTDPNFPAPGELVKSTERTPDIEDDLFVSNHEEPLDMDHKDVISATDMFLRETRLHDYNAEQDEAEERAAVHTLTTALQRQNNPTSKDVIKNYMAQLNPDGKKRRRIEDVIPEEWRPLWEEVSQKSEAATRAFVFMYMCPNAAIDKWFTYVHSVINPHDPPESVEYSIMVELRHRYDGNCANWRHRSVEACIEYMRRQMETDTLLRNMTGMSNVASYVDRTLYSDETFGSLFKFTSRYINLAASTERAQTWAKFLFSNMCAMAKEHIEYMSLGRERPVDDPGNRDNLFAGLGDLTTSRWVRENSMRPRLKDIKLVSRVHGPRPKRQVKSQTKRNMDDNANVYVPQAAKKKSKRPAHNEDD